MITHWRDAERVVMMLAVIKFISFLQSTGCKVSSLLKLHKLHHIDVLCARSSLRWDHKFHLDG